MHPTNPRPGVDPPDAGTLVAHTLRAAGTTHLFCLQGGHLDPILFGAQAAGLRIVDTRHEQAAAHMAEGWALATGETGVCAVTAGPGLSDAVTGLANAFQSGSPLVCLAGARPLAQADTWPLQDLDQIGIVRPVTKWARSCATPSRAGEYTAMALAEARNGRPGPVYLDVPADVLATIVPDAPPPRAPAPVAAPGPDERALGEALALLEGAERPLIVAGSGAHWSGAGAALARLAETAEIGVFTVNAGRGVIPDHHLMALGAAAPFGSAFPEAAAAADVVLCLGTRLGYALLNGAYFADATLIRVDLDAAETTRNRPGDLCMVADVRATADRLAAAWDAAASRATSAARHAWCEHLRERTRAARAELAREAEEHPAKYPHPLAVMRAAAEAGGHEATLVVDGGDTVTWGMVALPANGPGRLLTTGVYLGCLGVGIPFALAAKLARPEHPVILVEGDGSFGLNAMEFDTAIRHDLPFVCIVSNDGSWGMSRHGQDRARGGHVAVDLGVRPYHEMVRSLGGYGELVDDADELRGAVDRALESGLPSCINVTIDPDVCSVITEMMSDLGGA